MTPRSGEELNELEARQEPRLVKALEMVAPGTAVREGIDNIVHARTGGLIVVGVADDDQAAGARMDDVVDPFPHSGAGRDHLQRFDQPGLLPRFELIELLPGSRRHHHLILAVALTIPKPM